MLSVFTSLAVAGAISAVACQPPEPSGDTNIGTTDSGESSGDGDPTGDGDGDGDGDPTGDGDGDGDPTGDGDGDGDPTGDGDGDPGDGDGDGDPACVSALDIVFVVDNSGTMGTIQARLASSISGLIDPLDAAGVDWRIGITTSDNGNPWCQNGVTTPEAGRMVLVPCKQRLQEFLFNNGMVDATDLACNDVCSLDADWSGVTPTTTQLDPNPAPRPWVEKIDGVTNLADDVDPVAALGCLLPMGINGCGFEQQLESAYLALRRAENVAEDNYGFLRSDASLLVVIVSDEVDCSHDPVYSEIFDQDGNKAFWSDPASPFPTSAVCWNAGVECIGDPSAYDSCDPTNKDVDGNLGVADADAVLRPLSRYLDLLEGLEIQLQALDPNATVRVSILGGVGLDGTPTYAAALNDPDFQTSFGIGPGCTSPGINGLPPVRMRHVSAQTGGTSRSVCADEYASALTEIVEPFIGACR
jgi:hypothetical protein